MSAFIIRRGGTTSLPDVITGTFTPTSATTVTIEDLIGKKQFVISCTVSGSSAVGIICIIYADGVIRQYYKSLNTSSSPTATYVYLDTSENSAYFDPDTGTIDVSVINTERVFNTSRTYQYAVFG